MRRIVLLMVAAATCAWSQSIDFSSLDKLADKAKEANRVSLGPDQIRVALQFTGDDDDNKDTAETKKLLASLQNVTVRNYEFSRKGDYLDSDLDPVRNQISKLKGCSKIIDSKDDGEHSQIYICSEDGKPTGLAIIDAEPKELSVVYVKGSISMTDLKKLHGVMGLPSVEMGAQLKEEKKTK